MPYLNRTLHCCVCREKKLNLKIIKAMDKKKIEVPEGIRFLSDWESFNFSEFPSKCIINKQIPGCGFTEYCIRSNENIILCSPRKILLKNKYDQHQGEVYLVVNELDKDPGIDKDISKDSKTTTNSLLIESIESSQDRRELIYQRIYREIEAYRFSRFSDGFKPMKILVTYDSYHIVADILIHMGIFQLFYTVIDEFQSILHDSRFKSTTELKFLNVLQQRSHSALFVSATPMMDEYLEMLSEFKDLPYFELDWYTRDHSRVIKPSLKVLTMKSVGTKAEEIIETYLKGEFEKVVVMRDGKPQEIESREAVFYVNSVNHIISIIKRSGLTPDQVNILCADTEENRKRIKKRLGKDFEIGSVPLKGEVWKMFTFCTRTVYLGADFYSYCARSFIFSDSNSDCLAVDISEDLPQILGRQRLFENPWKNSATFYYRVTADYKKMDGEDFQRIIQTKREKTESLLRTYGVALDKDKQVLAEKYQSDSKNCNYRRDYVAVDNIGVSLVPVLNNLVMVNEIRAFKIQQIDYADRFAVFSTIHNKLTKDDTINQEASQFLEEYRSLTEARKKMILLCESSINGRLSKEAIQMVLDQIPDSDYIKGYYQSLGPEKLKNLGYKRNNIEKALGVVVFSPELLLDSVYSSFKVGDKLELSKIKTCLESLYESINYNKTPKAKDLLDYFESKLVYISVVDESTGKKKQTKGYELLRSKEHELREELKLAE